MMTPCQPLPLFVSFYSLIGEIIPEGVKRINLVGRWPSALSISSNSTLPFSNIVNAYARVGRLDNLRFGGLQKRPTI